MAATSVGATGGGGAGPTASTNGRATPVTPAVARSSGTPTAAASTIDALIDRQLPTNELRAAAKRVVRLGALVRTANAASQEAAKPVLSSLMQDLNDQRIELFDRLYAAACSVEKAVANFDSDSAVGTGTGTGTGKSPTPTTNQQQPVHEIDTALTAYYTVIQSLKRSVADYVCISSVYTLHCSLVGCPTD